MSQRRPFQGFNSTGQQRTVRARSFGFRRHGSGDLGNSAYSKTPNVRSLDMEEEPEEKDPEKIPNRAQATPKKSPTPAPSKTTGGGSYAEMMAQFRNRKS